VYEESIGTKMNDSTYAVHAIQYALCIEVVWGHESRLDLSGSRDVIGHSCEHSIGRIPFPIGVTLEPCPDPSIL